MRNFKYKLFPTKEQQIKLWQHANKLNCVYNYFLNQRIENYKNKIKTSKLTQQAELVTLKVNDEKLNEIHSQVIQQVTIRLDKSYKDFFRRAKLNKGHAGFPKFRSCRNFFGICYPQSGYSIKDNVFHTKVYGNITFSKHKDISGEIKQVYITCDVRNKWHICITTDFEGTKESSTDKVGIDIGLTNLVVATDGLKIKNCDHAKYFDKQIDKLKSLRDTNCKKRSRRYKKLSQVVRRLYGVKIRKIDDFQHKISKRLSRKYDTIYLENLNVKNMSETEKTGLNKAIRNSKLSQFVRFLDYKVNKIVKVNPVRTSMTCNNCGNIKSNLKLSDRVITCDKCRSVYDRDENAAKNIFCLGQAIDLGLCTELSTIQEALTLSKSSSPLTKGKQNVKTLGTLCSS